MRNRRATDSDSDAWLGAELKLAPSARSGKMQLVREAELRIGGRRVLWKRWECCCRSCRSGRRRCLPSRVKIVVVSPATSELNLLSESWRSAAVKAGQPGLAWRANVRRAVERVANHQVVASGQLVVESRGEERVAQGGGRGRIQDRVRVEIAHADLYGRVLIPIFNGANHHILSF